MEGIGGFMNKRQKGLLKVRQVKSILEQCGQKVEGPGYKPIWTGKAMMAVHKDFFGVFDLMSYSKDTGIRGHQITNIADKMIHAKAIFASGLSGDLWCYINNRGFNRYMVYSSTEGEMRIELLAEGIKPSGRKLS